MSAISVEHLRWFAILPGIALSACRHEDVSPGAAPAAAPVTYSASATVSGLNGTGLVLQNNGAGDISVTANGIVTFASMQASGAATSLTGPLPKR